MKIGTCPVVRLGPLNAEGYTTSLLVRRSCRARAIFRTESRAFGIRDARGGLLTSEEPRDNSVACHWSRRKEIPAEFSKLSITSNLTRGVLAICIAVLLLRPFLASARLAATFPHLSCLCAIGLFTQPKVLSQWRLHSSSLAAGSTLFALHAPLQIMISLILDFAGLPCTPCQYLRSCQGSRKENAFNNIMLGAL